MLLGDYLIKQRITQCDFAKSIDVTAPTIGRLLSGERDASAALARKIVAQTGGKVRFEDLYG